jgi:hypothetical protein
MNAAPKNPNRQFSSLASCAYPINLTDTKTNEEELTTEDDLATHLRYRENYKADSPSPLWLISFPLFFVPFVSFVPSWFLLLCALEACRKVALLFFSPFLLLDLCHHKETFFNKIFVLLDASNHWRKSATYVIITVS